MDWCRGCWFSWYKNKSCYSLVLSQVLKPLSGFIPSHQYRYSLGIYLTFYWVFFPSNVRPASLPSATASMWVIQRPHVQSRSHFINSFPIFKCPQTQFHNPPVPPPLHVQGVHVLQLAAMLDFSSLPFVWGQYDSSPSRMGSSLVTCFRGSFNTSFFLVLQTC